MVYRRWLSFREKDDTVVTGLILHSYQGTLNAQLPSGRDTIMINQSPRNSSGFSEIIITKDHTKHGGKVLCESGDEW